MHSNVFWIRRGIIVLFLLSLAGTLTAVPQARAGSIGQQRLMGAGPAATPVPHAVPGGSPTIQVCDQAGSGKACVWHAPLPLNTRPLLVVGGGGGGGGGSGAGVCLLPSLGVQVLEPFNPGSYVLTVGVSNICVIPVLNIKVAVNISMDCNGEMTDVGDFVAPIMLTNIDHNKFALLYDEARVSGCGNDFYAPTFTEFYTAYYSASLPGGGGMADYASAETSRTYSA